MSTTYTGAYAGTRGIDLPEKGMETVLPPLHGDHNTIPVYGSRVVGWLHSNRSKAICVSRNQAAFLPDHGTGVCRVAS